MASAQPATGARSRVASPGATAARKPGAGAPKAAAPPAVAPAKTAEAQTKHEDEVGVFGFHPEVERAVIWAPFTIFIFMMLAAGPFQETFKWVGLHCMETWVFFTAPFEKLITEHTGLLLALAAMTSLAPLAIFACVTAARAASEVEQNASSWQYAALVLLFVATLASFVYTGQFSGALQQWAVVSAPVEKVLIANADTIIAGCAALVIAPIAISIAVFMLKCMCGRKVSVTFEHEGAAGAANDAAEEKEVAQE